MCQSDITENFSPIPFGNCEISFVIYNKSTADKKFNDQRKSLKQGKIKNTTSLKSVNDQYFVFKRIWEFHGGLMARYPALSLLWLRSLLCSGFNLWPQHFHMLQASIPPKNKAKKQRHISHFFNEFYFFHYSSFITF